MAMARRFSKRLRGHRLRAKASSSSGVFRARLSASGAMRLAIPVSTLPEPTSTKRVTPPSLASHSMLSRQRTRPVTCSTSRCRIVSGSLSGRAVTLATNGTAGAWIAAEASAAAIQEVETAFAALPGKIPQIRSFEWGTNISPEKLDKGFTHGFILTFSNAADRDAYLVHPAHQEFGKLVGPVLADVFVVDFDGRR